MRKASSHHEHKITNSYGTYDYYKFYRKNKPKEKQYVLTESQYFAIIRKVNTALAELFVRGKEVSFPMRMGTIELRKTIKAPRIGPDGKVVYNTMIDWDNTMKILSPIRTKYLLNKSLKKFSKPSIINRRLPSIISLCIYFN